MSSAENGNNERNGTPPDGTPPEPTGLFGTLYKMAGVIETIAYAAQHDDLTGLLTKAAIKHEGEERIRAGQAFGVMLMDWDAFKKINDTLGHEVADRMLKAFGPYMDEHFRREGEVFAHETSIREPGNDYGSDYVVGRYGGDEFVGLVNLGDRKRPDGLTVPERMDKAEAYTRSVLAGFVSQQDPAVQALEYDVSLGTAIWEPGGLYTTFSEVAHEADMSMQEDKRAHRAPAR